MKLVDMHCDTISELLKQPESENLDGNHLCVDLRGMEQAGTLVQFFACFVNAKKKVCPSGYPAAHVLPAGIQPVLPGEVWEDAYQDVQKMICRMRQEENERLRIALSFHDIMKNKEKNVISAIMTVEEGGVLNGKMERIKDLYQSGIRLITLTWNYENCLGYPNSRDRRVMEKGLKPFGYDVVRRMNELGMLVDVSHLSDGGFWDCVKCSSVPIVASHSNARALCNHPRNLSDEMLKALAEKGGVAGLNFYPAFLREKGKVELADLARHAVHMIQVAGEEIVAIGTDFDGFEPEKDLNYITHVSEMEKVWEALKKAGITERQIDKIQSENALRVMQEVLG